MKDSGWSWAAFFLGPIWYLSNGLVKKGFIMVLIVVISCFLAIPFILIYCGVKGKSDLYEMNLRTKSRIDLKEL